MRSLRVYLASLLTTFVVLETSVLSLQAQVITTSSFTGKVLDEKEKPVAGAAIHVVHEPTGTEYDTTTRSDGSFVLRGLRPGGPYKVSTSAANYPKVDQGGVYLDIDRGADLTIHVGVTQDEIVHLETLEVSAGASDQLFDPNRTGGGSYMTNEDIRELPSGDRSINSLARLDPRISYNRDPQDRAISVNGMNNRYNSIQVDGVSANDPFGINANNTAAERNVIPLDSLEALAVSTSPYYSRNAGFVGAQINAITKSGTNQFHGSAYYTYRGRSAFGGMRMVGMTIDDVSRPLADFSEETFGATLGGPIIPKRLFFYVAYEKVDENRIAPTPVAATPQATIDQIVAAATSLGFKPGSAQPPTANKLTDKNILAKLDWQINSMHRASLRYNKTESSRPTFPGFGSGISENNFSFDSSWYQQNISNESYMGQLISRWSEKLNTELSYSHSKYHSERETSPVKQPYVQIRNVTVPGSSNTSFITFGTENSSQANILDVKTDTAEVFASYDLTDRQTLQTGFQYETA
ncbi:MAG: TonB-dependent receptor, partial [Nibricoccus sp.]